MNNENMNDYSKYNGTNNNPNNYNYNNQNNNENNNYQGQDYNNYNENYNNENYNNENYNNENIKYEENNSKNIFKTIIFVVIILLIVFLAVYLLVLKNNNLKVGTLSLDIQNKQIEIFESFKINATIDNVDLSKIKWTSNNNNCSVTNGEVYTKSKGECIIEARYKKQKRKVNVTITVPNITNSVYAEKIGFDKGKCLYDTYEEAKNNTCKSSELIYTIRQYPKDSKYVDSFTGAFNYNKSLKEITSTYDFNNKVDEIQKEFNESDLYFQEEIETFFCTPSGTSYKCPDGINVHCFATYDAKINKQNRKCIFFNIKD